MLKGYLNGNKLAYGLILLLTIICIFVYYLKDSSVTKKPKQLQNYPNWIVVTINDKPTEDLKKLVKITGWRVVVVGDVKTPNDFSLAGAEFLSVDDQMQLGYQITAQLPVNSYTRKMIGYLYAIQNGAKYIYDTDDDNHPASESIDFYLEPTMTGLVYDDLSQPIVNPLAHFGESELWPRGYPSKFISLKPNRTYQLCTFKTPAIQQKLVTTVNVTFDHRSPPMTIPTGVFAPFNSQNTLFAYDAFWALFLPTTVAYRATDIWRGYWAQPLLWLLGQHLAFFPPATAQVRNANNYLNKSAIEQTIYKDVGALIELLSSWKCDQNSSFFECVLNVTKEMNKHNFIQFGDVSLTEMWLQDLMAVGYHQPNISTQHELCSEPGGSNWALYSPPQQKANGFQEMTYMCTHNVKNVSKYFNNINQKEVHNPSYTFDNVLLVIVFNFPFLGNIRTLETLYRDHFPNVLFCGEANGYSELMKLVNSTNPSRRTGDISFVNLTAAYQGWYGYECAIRAIAMGYKVDGYMFLGDDVLLKPWKMRPFNVQRSRIENDKYGPHRLQNRYNDTCTVGQLAPWWGRTCGKEAMDKALNEIEKISLNDTDGRSETFKKYISNRFANGVNMNLVSYSMSDFYYISKRDAAMFTEVLQIFHKHEVFLEIAVPTALIGCREGDPQTDDGFPGDSLWGNDRAAPFKYFTKDSVYVHPLKLPSLIGNSNLLESYCTHFVEEYLRTW